VQSFLSLVPALLQLVHKSTVVSLEKLIPEHPPVHKVCPDVQRSEVVAPSLSLQGAPAQAEFASQLFAPVLVLQATHPAPELKLHADVVAPVLVQTAVLGP
jgi:hypothetical protein